MTNNSDGKLTERLRAQAVNAAKVMQIIADAKTARQTDRDDAWTTAGYGAPTKEQTLEWKAADTITALVEALERQGLALAAFVNLIHSKTETLDNGEDILTGKPFWSRPPSRAEVQEALNAQNGARAALSLTSSEGGE